MYHHLLHFKLVVTLPKNYLSNLNMYLVYVQLDLIYATYTRVYHKEIKFQTKNRFKKEYNMKKLNEDVKIVENSCINLDLIGKTITHKHAGKGVVVGYSSVSGEPFAVFYNDKKLGYRACCFSHKDII